MRLLTKSLLCLFIFTVAAVSIKLSAGPTVIRDNRITDLATTPLLGRGYSIGTNTFQSSCLKKVILTEPSYDMEYYFESGEVAGKESSSRTQATSRSQSSSYSRSKRKSFFGFGSKSTFRQTYDIQRSSTTSVRNNRTYYNHDLYATIDLYSYYASLDEGRSQLSNSAMTLLQRKDLPGFFSSCGPYYVRSIGRKARLISRFSYQTETESRDISFESRLRTSLKRFSSSTSWGWTSSTTTTSSSEDTQEQTDSRQFNSEATRTNLTITTAAYGLGKNEKATLISYDLQSFKLAIKDAFMAMQNPRTGKVVSIEVVPWVENTEFQALVGLEKSEDVYDVEKDAEGKPVIDPATKEPKKKLVKKGQVLYEKKITLNLNAEFLMEIERVDRNLLNMFYKARLCRKNIDGNWKQGGALTDNAKNLLLTNHKTGDLKKLSELDTYLTEERVNNLLKKERCFMYGKEGGDEECKVPKGGASACIKTIMDKGIFSVSYRLHEECKALQAHMGEVEDETVDYYCMPVPLD